MEHNFMGKWISDEVFSSLEARNVFHRQLEPLELDCSEHRNRHILFRKTFSVTSDFSNAKIFISADDYYKLYINGRFVGQGPAPSYHFRCNYNEIDISAYLVTGENVIAVHTLYQGLINRVWQSGDFRHGLICDIVIDGKTVLSSDETFKIKSHSGYREIGVCGYQTQFLEEYDSRSPETGFEKMDFDDSGWELAEICRFDDHIMTAQKSHMLVFENVSPKTVSSYGSRIVYDFGSNYVGYLSLKAHGKSGDVITIRCGQELNDNGSVRFELRANCRYEEKWILSGGDDILDWFDYKAFRYAEIEVPGTAEINDAVFNVRHYPFELKTTLKKEYADNTDLKRIWELCVHTQKYGVQEVIQDCMEREKGFYLGDGCYTALANMILTDDDTMVRKLIDDAFSSSFITDTLVTCMDCSFMQEIAEYPLIMVILILWHYRFTKDIGYLRTNYPKLITLLEAYRHDYETDGLLRNLDKWCVVEWPANFQHGYAADIREGKICEEAHVSINAYYIYAIRIANEISEILGEEKYRDIAPMESAFRKVFYDSESKLFRDCENSDHISLVGNSFVYAFGLFPDEESRQSILELADRHGIASLSMFCTFPILMGFARDGEDERIKNALLHSGAWLRMLREDATTTFEGWGRDTKWNTSLFHMTMSYGSVFMADIDLKELFK